MTDPSGSHNAFAVPRVHGRLAGLVNSGDGAAATDTRACAPFNSRTVAVAMEELSGFHHATHRIYAKDAPNGGKGLRTAFCVYSDGVPIDPLALGLRIKLWVRMFLFFSADCTLGFFSANCTLGPYSFF